MDLLSEVDTRQNWVLFHQLQSAVKKTEFTNMDYYNFPTEMWAEY